MVNFVILIILHLLGDFYLQTAKVAKCKNAKVDMECHDCSKCKKNSKWNYKYILIHVLLYLIPFISLLFIADLFDAIKMMIIIFVSHLIIDTVSCFLNKKTKQTVVLVIDQFLHILVLFFIYKMFSFNAVFENYTFIIKAISATLTLFVPCSVFINKLFEDLYPKTINKGIFDVGSIIGVFERLLVMIFSYFGNFAAIAIIITVKTWARSNDLKETEFRNKYLLGTLASLVLALCGYILYKIVL